jgi:hypothetical protein
MAGAFFPHTDLHMPEEEVGSHGGEHMMMPPAVFADFIVIHAQLGCGLFEAWFDGPPQATSPHEQG